MSRGIQRAREAIKQRKKSRDNLVRKKMQRKYVPIIDEEEKHGFPMPVYNDTAFDIKGQRRMLPSHMSIKALISILLFVSLAFLLTSHHPSLKGTKIWVAEQMQEDFPFAKVHDMYVSAFGNPISIAPHGDITLGKGAEGLVLPVMGHVVETFAVNGTGIMISPKEKTQVTALNKGIVIFVGNDQQTKKTVIVQHADGSKTTYGYLSSTDVHIYQNVQANQAIGTFTPTNENEMVYFSIEKDNQFIDPAQVIPVDDIP